MNIIPTFDNVAVLLDRSENMTKSGIALPSTAKPGNVTGIVHTMGECVNLEFMEVGDRVLLADDCKGAAIPLPDNRMVLVVSSEHILAVIRE